MNSVEEVRKIKEDLDVINSSLKDYNFDNLKYLWNDKASDEFIAKIKDIYNCMNEMNDELTKVENCLVGREIG